MDEGFRIKTFVRTFSWRITINAFGRYSKLFKKNAKRTIGNQERTRLVRIEKSKTDKKITIIIIIIIIIIC